MKRNHLLTFLFLFAFASLFGQAKHSSKAVQMGHQKALPAVTKHFTGFETLDVNHAESVPPSESSLLDLVGTTVYDLQSNGGVGHRVLNWGNGDVSAVYTFSLDVPGGYADRGSGYNSATGGVWGADPTSRIESARTGFTNLAVDVDGTEYVVSHLGSNAINIAKRPQGGSWTESSIPATAQLLWARAAIGGSNGKTLHVIASTTPTGNGGATWMGMDGVVLYYRSQDGGATWDVKDMLFPGIDSDNFTGTDLEGYAIDANGDNVAVFITNTWNKSLLYVSDDNGTTWTQRVVNDFPLTKYVVNTGYDTLSLPPDPYRTDVLNDPYAIFTADGTADVLVDDGGVAHCWYGATYVSDADLTDAGWTFYPGSNIGIVYFNTLMGDDEGVVSGYCPDIDNNQQLDIVDISNYGFGLSCHPAGSIDANGNLYVTYATVHELYNDANTGYNFRQPFIVRSQDYGQTWSDPTPIMRPDLLGDDSSDVPYVEALWISAAKLADNKVHTTFQVDYSPLTYLNSSTEDTEAGDNTIRYVGFPVSVLDAKNVPAETLKFSVSPNPANDRMLIQFNSDKTQQSWVELYDIYGKTVRTTTPVTVGSGNATVTIHTADLPTGMYVARINLGNSFATQKVIIQH